MITSKQRAYLRSLSNDLPAIIQIGKGGIGEKLLITVSDALEARELIKITVLESCELSPREASDSLCDTLSAEGVSVVGRKVVLYRESENKKTIELPDTKKKRTRN